MPSPGGTTVWKHRTRHTLPALLHPAGPCRAAGCKGVGGPAGRHVVNFKLGCFGEIFGFGGVDISKTFSREKSSGK